MRWENKSPVTYQAYHNYEFKKKVATCDESFHGVYCVKVPRGYRQNILQPSTEHKYNAAMMFLTNLGEPEWVNVENKKNLLIHVFSLKFVY